ncbi:MAG: DMT family transporter [Proteobacteria bacterium]|nr:DMT family transporter [Pseudomonadota bacterium]MBS0571712.1 DMT family transporter [Pseudomonadota bacterium]
MTPRLLRAAPNVQGILLNLSAIFVFSLMDALAKHLVQSGYPALQVVWTRYIGQTLILTILIAPRALGLLATRHPLLQAARSVAQFGASVFFFLSLGRIELASATAIADLSPLLITLGAALFLGEGIGPRRLIAVGAAIAGAVLIIRPGSDLFSPAALLPLACAFSFATFALLTRAMGPGEGLLTSLFYSALFGTLITSAIQPFVWVPVARQDLWAFVLIGLMGTVAQVFLIRAYARAPAAVIAPFGYFGILFATVWGLVFFAEWPDRLTVLGALVIVGAGLYVWHREARAAS